MKAFHALVAAVFLMSAFSVQARERDGRRGGDLFLTDGTLLEQVVVNRDLRRHHEGCSFNNVNSVYCRAAISRYCMARGFETGFGPLEWSGGIAHIACVNPYQAARIETTLWELQGYHRNIRMDNCIQDDIFCRSASQRLCTDYGFSGGLGVVEMGGPGTIIVACSADALPVHVSVRELNAKHRSCPSAFKACNAAVSRYCQQEYGAVTGFGPVEYGAGNAVGLCVW